MEIKNKLTVTRAGVGEGWWVMGKEGEGSSQGTCVKDPWTKTMRGKIESGSCEVGRAGESNVRKMRTTVIEQ